MCSVLDALATPEYYEGEEAARSGKPIDDCPYLAATKRYMWRTGWENYIYSDRAPE